MASARLTLAACAIYAEESKPTQRPNIVLILADGFEEGRRVPFTVRWPGKITAGTKSDQAISLVDIMATCADSINCKLPGC